MCKMLSSRVNCCFVCIGLFLCVYRVLFTFFSRVYKSFMCMKGSFRCIGLYFHLQKAFIICVGFFLCVCRVIFMCTNVSFMCIKGSFFYEGGSFHTSGVLFMCTGLFIYVYKPLFMCLHVSFHVFQSLFSCV